LLTTELLDTDPITSDPHVDPFASDAHGPIFGYPPVYYQNASDFESATSIPVAAGQTQTVDLSLVKKRYYRVKLPVVAAGGDDPASVAGVTVYAGHRGPGFSLGYNQLHRAVEGMLPDGSYTVEVMSFGSTGSAGSQTITIKGGPVEGPSIVLTPHGSIAVHVSEEFTAADRADRSAATQNGRILRGPRSYLNVTLEPASDFAAGRNVSLRGPNGLRDESLILEGAAAGRYWVRVKSSRGYAAAIRAGNVDLQHQPLLVGVGGNAPPIEITMRDDWAEIGGTVDGVTPPAKTEGEFDRRKSDVHVYCIPLAESSGQFTELKVGADGSLEPQQVVPGAYRLLAFDREQTQIEYRNPEAMRVFDAKGVAVRVAGGQKELVTLQLSTSGGAANATEGEP
jgi:hypothetical protein